ncbi:hypothetical protein L226DRAFT_519948 [Lentinus tigrinus ALCF2SS1-7]|uniref:Uncharacterized protein n=1 Tax=Lentinus tigrinus ALCF2SS1-6 TaxID=1328759 RepID=A0A5C2SRY1_9APHY|nr:hypothetical protein L227DRAFT_560006 [Lentinus tigrinus ALCF2SS1-6]RPD80575.1 hypothetical protein L226DRAFT_519948 [Lentinus tigrinus ALCF2SS1-7]
MAVTPSQPVLDICEVAGSSGQADEAWNSPWSHDSTRLVSSKDKTVLIWDIEYHQDMGCTGPKGFMREEASLTNRAHYRSPRGYPTATDSYISADGDDQEEWDSSFSIQDFVITPDATRLFALGRPKLEIPLTKEVTQKLNGPTQTHLSLRSCFIGASEQFVASGSEVVPTDGDVYVWDRSPGTLVKTLSGHGTRCVDAVASNPANRNIFASASYDSTVRLWELK